MTTTVEAIYDDGVLRLIDPLALAKGTRVEVSVNIREPALENDGKTPAEILAEIAAMPMQPGGEEFSGRDHDRILYGENGAR